ncbi:unnamed protein product [Closterium sp. NIES-53]
MRDGEYRVGQLIPGEVPGTGGTTGTRSPTVAHPTSPLACAAVHSLCRGLTARCPSLLLAPPPPHHGSLTDPALGRSPGVAADYRVSGSLAHVRAPGANKLSARIRLSHVTPQLYSPQHPIPVVSGGAGGAAAEGGGTGAAGPSGADSGGLSHVTPQLYSPQHPIPVVSGGAGGAAAEGGGTGAAGPSGADSGGAAGVRMETTLVEDTAGSTRRPHPASPPGFSSNPRFPPRSSLWQVTVEPGGILAGGTRDTGGAVAGGSGSGGAGAEDTGSATPTPRTLHFLTREQRLLRLEREEPEQFERAQQQQQHQ